MPDLPRPRDRDRLLDAINWLMGCGGRFEPREGDKGNYWFRSAFARRAGECLEYDRDAGRYVWSVPPVSEASPEGMPELRYPWGFLDVNGESEAAWTTREEAVAECARLDADYRSDAPHRPVRLTVAEVARGPETAPSGWRYEVKRTPHARRWSLRADGASGSWWTYENEPRWALIDAPYIPPIDREHVARLLGGNDAE